MPIRNQKITPYNSSASGLTDKREKPGTVQIKSDVSKFKKSPSSDSLYKALKAYPPIIPNVHHAFKHSGKSKPSGANYKPSQEYGPMHQTGKGKGVYTYGKAPGGKGGNAVPGGGPDGRSRASNAGPGGGRAPNTRGQNANMYPRISNRPGGNAVPGGGPDGLGRSGNALAKALTMRFGGKKP